MPSMSEKPPFPFDAETFRRWFGGTFLFGDDTARTPWVQPEWVENYVNEMLKARNPFVGSASAEVGYDLYDSEDELRVRVPIPEHIDPRNLTVRAGRQSLAVSGLEERLHVVLPASIQQDQTRAIYKNGVLQIRMKKWSGKEPMQDIPVRILGK